MIMIPPGVEGPSFHPIVTALWIILLLTFCDPGVARTNDSDTRQGLCPPEARFGLFNVTRNGSGFVIESGDGFPMNATRISIGERRGCICDLKPCLALCPPEETDTGKRYVVEDYANYAAIPRIYTTNLTFDDVAEAVGPKEWFHTFVWSSCPMEQTYPLEPEKYAQDEFYLLGNGSLFRPRAINLSAQFLNLDMYCLQLQPDNTSYVPMVCYSSFLGFKDPDFLTHHLQDIGGLVSVPFIIATLIVYSVLPELRNIHGATLRCYLCCLTVANIAMAALRIPGPDSKAGPWCLFLGFTVYFSFMSCFLWLNVICFDLWWRFGGFGSIRRVGVQDDRKKLFWYSLYAWGISGFSTLICIGMEFAPDVPESLIRPGFRHRACWFETSESVALYYFGPIGLMIFCNICLFVSTSIKLYLHERSTRHVFDSEDSGRHNSNKKWLRLHLKLFFVMGICWSTDPIQLLWDGPKYFWLFADMVNALQGLLIFLIFVCKKNIWLSLRNRFGKKILGATWCQRFGSRNHADSRSVEGINNELGTFSSKLNNSS